MPIVGVILALILCTVLVWFLLWATRSLHQITPATFDPILIDADLAHDREIRAYIAAGHLLQAIKLYRELTNCSLSEARDAIHFIRDNPHYDFHDKPKHNSPLDAGIRDLIRTGRKLDAIRIYQDFTGADVSDAQDEIERIAWEEAERSTNHHR